MRGFEAEEAAVGGGDADAAAAVVALGYLSVPVFIDWLEQEPGAIGELG